MTTDSARITALEKRVDALEGGRPGRKARPIVISEEHVCGLDPSIESATCPHASLYRRNQGCKGDACMNLSSTYYRDRRIAKKAQAS